ncbi:FGGY-family carbohydrate kinase [Vibrio parahaemolyticus]|uniref:FGGY-family carbohydrate kinase n=1 Tax=Vibrio parahaemolyticus TaxID=670 RepID=UPI00214CEA18|nr:FGGY-family carbohydrate kinase [Vibrio parahaemolyticus]
MNTHKRNIHHSASTGTTVAEHQMPNQRLKGVVSGLNLGSSAPDIFYSLVESTAHGAKAIMDCMTTQGVDVNRVLAIGGIAQKSPLVMQICADVMGTRHRSGRSNLTNVVP